MMKMMKFDGKYAISNDTPMVIISSQYYVLLLLYEVYHEHNKITT